jgi:hypothetical protein
MKVCAISHPDRDTIAPELSNCWFSASKICLIKYVIVKQGGRVNPFNDSSQMRIIRPCISRGLRT